MNLRVAAISEDFDQWRSPTHKGLKNKLDKSAKQILNDHIFKILIPFYFQ